MIDAVLRPNGSGASTRMTRTANVGTARPTFDTPTASPPPRWTWPSHSPIGIPIRQAMPSAAAETPTCSSSRCGIPLGPCQFAGSWNQATTSPIQPSGHPSAPPRHQEPLGPQEHDVEDERDDDAEHGRRQHLRLEVALQAGLDEVSQPTAA